MADPKQKKTFGGARIEVIRPAPKENSPKSENLLISFEEALKLHLAIGQALGKLNSYNRRTREGKRSCMNLCIHFGVSSATVQIGKLPVSKITE